MNVEELLIQKPLKEFELENAIAFTFNLLPSEIAIVEEISGEEDTTQLKLICQYEQILGDYRIKVYMFGINSQDQDLYISLIQKLANFIQSDCLIPDGDSFSPFDMILVSPMAEAKSVRLSSSQFEQEKYELEAS